METKAVEGLHGHIPALNLTVCLAVQEVRKKAVIGTSKLLGIG